MRTYDVIIVGAGPAGLTAAVELTAQNKSVLVLEQDAVRVGGISKTISYKGFRFDIGGHRFFSKSQEIEDFWTKILGDQMLVRPRSSRIFYRGQFYSYPLNAGETLRKLGFIEALLCVFSYFKALLFSFRKAKNFEEWVCQHFGRRLFLIFFKSYTEKVWGMDCKEISADWAAQRIRGLSLWKTILHMILPQKGRSGSKTIKTLIDSFRYPRLGPGMMWEAAALKMQNQGGELILGAKAQGFIYQSQTELWTVTYSHQGKADQIQARHVISSAPLRELMAQISPEPKCTVESGKLKYRDFITVALMLKGQERFTDNWIYIHDPQVKVGRIQNYKSWSPEMVPSPDDICYGLEYFCFAGDGLWSLDDEDLIGLAKREIETVGLALASEIRDAFVVRQEKAYPVYDEHYQDAVAAVRMNLAQEFPRLHLVGRNGMHKYNNQDHAMMTALLTVKNILAEKTLYNVWQVNEDADYHEGTTALSIETRLVPRKIAS